jgi:hypothetical protein
MVRSLHGSHPARRARLGPRRARLREIGSRQITAARDLVWLRDVRLGGSCALLRLLRGGLEALRLLLRADVEGERRVLVPWHLMYGPEVGRDLVGDRVPAARLLEPDRERRVGRRFAGELRPLSCNGSMPSWTLLGGAPTSLGRERYATDVARWNWWQSRWQFFSDGREAVGTPDSRTWRPDWNIPVLLPSVTD